MQPKKHTQGGNQLGNVQKTVDFFHIVVRLVM